MKTEEALVYESRIKVPYRWSAGETGTRFLTELRDRSKLVGLRCPRCGKVRVPPRRHCPECFVRCQDWVEVGPGGELVSFTQASQGPLYGLVKLDGADTALLHLLGGCGLSELRRGLRVEAVFESRRRGSILDLRHFRPVRG